MISHLVKEIKNTRSECTEFYSRYFSAKLSPYITAICIKLKVKANTVTSFILLSGLISVFLLFSETKYIQVIGALSLVLVNIWDTVDGEIARYTKTTSKVGVFFDLIYQIAIDIIVFFSVGLKLYLDTNNILFMLPSILLIFFHMLTVYSTLAYGNLMIFNEKKNKNTYLNISFSSQKSLISKLSQLFTTNGAFFHLYWIFLVIDLIFDNSLPYAQILFLSIFSLLNMMKFFIKFNKAIVSLR